MPDSRAPSNEPVHLAYVGLGSNLGDRRATLDRALTELRATPGIDAVRRSPIYETAPVGFVDQPPFLNAVAELRTSLGPVQVFVRMKQIEARLGRTPTFRWGPREIDLDLLLYDRDTIRRRGLIVPHPAMCERAFVLVPLRDLRPDLRDPSGRTLDEILKGLGRVGDAVRRLDRSDPNHAAPTPIAE